MTEKELKSNLFERIQNVTSKMNHADKLMDKELFCYYSGYLVGLKEAWLVLYGNTKGL